MNRTPHFASLLAKVLLAVSAAEVSEAQPSNLPPAVTIIWPPTNCPAYFNNIFGPAEIIKIKAVADDRDGSISRVDFYADAELIGTITNAPFDLLWKISRPPGSGMYLKVVALDDVGASTESIPVWIAVAGGLVTIPVFEIVSPPSGGVFAAPGTFVFSAELLASPHGDTGLVEFFVGTNSGGTVTQSGPFTNTTPLYTVTVTNIPEGNYGLSVRKDNFFTGYFATGSCDPPKIIVTRLGMHSSKITSSNRFAFEVVTSFPTNQNIIEASSNLVNWTPISTNVPMTNSFTFTEPSPATNSPRFYRALVPSQ